MCPVHTDPNFYERAGCSENADGGDVFVSPLTRRQELRTWGAAFPETGTHPPGNTKTPTQSVTRHNQSR